MVQRSVGQIANNARRVDVDDFVALAVAIDVSPITLLAAPRDSPDDAPVEVTGSGAHTARQAWEWLRANYPLDFDIGTAEEFPTAFREKNFPGWPSERTRRERTPSAVRWTPI